jgi:radical SAM superfamily enzyme YgiQ (UPF0313 family)
MITSGYSIASGRGKKALLINPPIYDTRYWDRWSQPYGLLKIAANLQQKGYQIELIDCLYTDPKSRRKKLYRKKIQVGDVLMTIYHFGLSLEELQKKLFQLEYIPDQIYITSIMTYWWESTRDVIDIVKNVFPKSEVILGGIYPTLCPNHAEDNTRADIVVVGEVKEASDLWTELSFYPKPPDYAVITSSRGCPYDCAHCAQKQINGVGVRHRAPEDIVSEIIDKEQRHGIRKFAFYEDNILIDCQEHFERIIDLLLAKGQKLHFSAPEGFEVRLLYPELLRKMKEVGFRSIYLPLEVASFDDKMKLDQKDVHLDEFEKAVEYCRQAGYKPGIRQELNAFILYGVPNQPLDKLIETILYAAHLVGNVTPMLYTPVPGSRLYKKYENYFFEKKMDLEHLNGKLFPFWEMNDVMPSDYIDLQRLMYALHTQLRGESFDLLENKLISKLVRQSLINWENREIN